jgi:hypothetical protein
MAVARSSVQMASPVTCRARKLPLIAVASRLGALPATLNVFCRYINVDDVRNRHAVLSRCHGLSYSQSKDLAWGHCSVLP